MHTARSVDGTMRREYQRRLTSGGIALLIAAMCAIISVVAQLRTSAAVEHAIDLVHHGDALLDDILSSQGQFRLFAITRDTNALNSQLRLAASAEWHLAQVRALTRNNEAQQRRLDALRDALRDLGDRRRADRIPADPVLLAAYLRDPRHVTLRDSVSRLASAIIATERSSLDTRLRHERLASVALVSTLVAALILAMFNFLWTVRAQERHEASLQASERRFRLISEQNPDGVVLIGPSGIAYANRAAAALLGVPDPAALLDVQLWSFAVEQDRLDVIERAKHVMQLGETGEPRVFRFLRKDGEEVALESRATPVPVGDGTMALVSLRDVTERRQVDARLRQSAKLEAVGTLAGGLAHDFNNLLAIIRMGAEMMRDQATFGPPTPDDAQAILAATERGRTITRQLLAFARRNVVQVSRFAVDTLLDDSASFVARVLAPGQQLDVQRGAPNAFVHADRTEIELALMNLLSNARDVAPVGTPIQLRTALATIADADLVRPPDLAAGEYVLLQVHDAGSGLTPEARDHLFEPFFTTKPPGAGTGLGLATVYGIARRAGGTVTCESGPTQGTTFSIWLPIVSAPASEATAASTAATTAPSDTAPTTPITPVADVSAYAQQRVLVVDDEDAVRLSVARMLTRVGFQVVVAESGDEALSVLAAAHGRFDVLLTDFGMPRMNGASLIDAARVRYPWLRTVLMSGYTGDEVVRQTLHGSTTTFLQKRFELAALVEAVAGTEVRGERGD